MKMQALILIFLYTQLWGWAERGGMGEKCLFLILNSAMHKGKKRVSEKSAGLAIVRTKACSALQSIENYAL